MRIWFDTEFIEDGKTIDLLSIGLLREDGWQYYAEPLEADLSKASPWVRENVLPHLCGPRKPRAQIAGEIVEFAGKDPEFWAYFAAYDWVALCQLFGTMMDLPKGWPMYVRDFKQLAGDGFKMPDSADEHNALADARMLAAAHSAWEAQRRPLTAHR
jgi:hypothetical protein